MFYITVIVLSQPAIKELSGMWQGQIPLNWYEAAACIVYMAAVWCGLSVLDQKSRATR